MQINDPIDQQKKLNIIAIADNSDYGYSALRYGEKLAEVFDASLTVVTNFGFSLENKNGIPNTIHSPQSSDCHIRTDYFFPERLYHYAEETNTIMFVIGIDPVGKEGLFNKKKALRFIKPSRLPVMTVGKKLPSENAFKQVVLPIDIERQAKEKALWAGYFSRFYQATIHIMHPYYEDEGLQKQVTDNIAFVEKLYHNLDISYVLDKVDPQPNIDLYSLDFANRVEATLTVIMMTRYYTLADLLTGPQEKKVIGNPQEFPVLCINQRDDLYVLCT